MDPTCNKVQLICFLILYGSLLVETENVIKLTNGPAGKCQDTTSICKGSYVTELDSQCSDNQRFCSDIHHLKSTGQCDAEDLRIITRDAWGARTSSGNLNTLSSGLSFFIVHHAAGYDCSDTKKCLQQMKKVQKLHQSPDKGYSDIGYQYVIGGDGTVFEGRGLKHGAQSPGYNTKSIGVCLLGNFMNTLPSDKAISSLKKLHTCLQNIGALSTNNSVFGHRDVRPTSCPGTKFYDEILTKEFGSFWHSIEPVMWTNCKVDKKGECKSKTTETCEGTWESNLCPGSNDNVCCIPKQ